MATKKTTKPVKKAAAKKPAPKAAAKKVVAKAPAKKTVTKKAAPAKKVVVKKAAATKPSKPAAKKEVKKTNVKTATKKPVVAKATPKKAAPKKAAPKKAAPKAAVTKTAAKPAVKKAVVKTLTKKVEVKKAVASPKAAPAPKAPAPTKEVKPAAAKAAVKKTAAKPAGRPRSRTKAADAEVKPVSSKPLVTVGAGPSMPRVTPMVAVQVSTLEAGDKVRYSDAELEEFRTIINAKLEDARKDYELLKQTLANTDNNGTEDTSPSFKMIEDGSETLGREETAQLAGRQEKFIKHLEDALLRIRNKTYGICRVTGKLISKERLRLVPHATLSIEAKQQMSN